MPNKEIIMKEEISVVVPVFNREHMVEATLRSIKAQTWRPLHLVLVDNNSTDGSLRVIREWKRRNEDESFRVTVVEQPHPGACAARNRGFAEVTTDKVMFFDSDDTMRPRLVELAAAAFEGNRDADIVCWPCAIHMENGSTRVPPFDVANAMECHLIHAMLRPQGYMMRSSLLRQAGGWNESLPAWNDWELGVRLLLNSKRIAGVDEILADIYAHANSITGTGFSQKRGVWERSLDAVEDAIESSGRKDAERLSAIVDYRRVILAAHYVKEGRGEDGKTLADGVLHGGGLSRKRRGLLRFAYAYTRRGMRGAWRLIRHLY